ncbi:acyl-CoA dehydrogenase family member 9, mitochondrial-like [Platysternon megacephalum]|uniref:Acyl-CoA dehydrogenase family member 9, mitochondrial-like n=1 Tax=Platysternon megacephalum TaxID=55544 RepID=A0A4D9F664_9SAUR|nr:acyl-CoA dehydrogenase family member 9, mitochondrial-like [Platysternon megacephalum]
MTGQDFWLLQMSDIHVLFLCAWSGWGDLGGLKKNLGSFGDIVITAIFCRLQDKSLILTSLNILAFNQTKQVGTAKALHLQYVGTISTYDFVILHGIVKIYN